MRVQINISPYAAEKPFSPRDADDFTKLVGSQPEVTCVQVSRPPNGSKVSLVVDVADQTVTAQILDLLRTTYVDIVGAVSFNVIE